MRLLAWTVMVLSTSIAPLRAQAQSAPTQGVSEGEILVGMSAAFSGTARELGRNMKVGYEVAFAAANEAGGVNGRRLKLLARDDGNEPSKAPGVVKELVEKNKVFAFVGNVGTSAIESYLPYLLDRRILLFGAHSGGELLRNDPPDRYVFNFRASYVEEVAAATRHLVEVKRIPPSAIAFFGQEDGYGESGWKGFSRVLRKHGRDPATAVRTGFKRNTVDVDDAVKRIKANPRLRAVVMVATHRPAARFIEKLHGTKLLFTNASAVEAHDLADDLAQIGKAYGEGVIVTQVVPLPSSHATAVMRYQEALRRYAPGERPDFLSLQAYLSGSVFIEGLKRAGRDLTTDRMVDALESIKDLDLGIGVPISFGPSEHQGSHKVWGTVLEAAGGWKTVDLE